jgi:hypothetical protein
MNRPPPDGAARPAPDVPPAGGEPRQAAPGVTPDEGGRAVTRRDLESIIRRASELSSSEADADERIPEEEVVRIAAEIGLQPRHVRQAMYEVPSLRVTPAWGERYFGSPIVASVRAVPGESRRNARQLEEYLTTREYMQLVRRRNEQFLLEPAEDAISSIARGILRPGSRHHLSRARRVLVTVQPLDDASTHVRIEADLDEQRRSHLRNGIAAGTIGGVIIGAVGQGLVGMAFEPTLIATAGQVLAVGGALAASVTAGVMTAGASFRRRVAQARAEMDALLDRAERGERLDPPPAPWRRRLQSRFGGGEAPR